MKKLYTTTKYQSLTSHELFAMISKPKWDTLKKVARLQVLQEFENRAAAEQGRDPLRVLTFRPKGKFANVLGFFTSANESTKRFLFLNRNFLEKVPGSVLPFTPGQAVATLLHEGRHAYQRAVVDGKIPQFDPDMRRVWAMNFGNYMSPNNTPTGDMLYIHQETESDARHFAASILKRMYNGYCKLGHQKDIDIEKTIQEIDNREYMYEQMAKKFLTVDMIDQVDGIMRMKYMQTHPNDDVNHLTAFGSLRELLGETAQFDEKVNELAADALINAADLLEDIVELLLGNENEVDGLDHPDDLKELFKKGSVDNIMF